MSNLNLKNADVAVFYIEGVPPTYFDDFRELAKNDLLNLVEESRENTPYMAIEWVVPTAIAIYVGMKFVDAFIKRAADDVADALYPRFKSAVQKLANRILIKDRNAFSVITSVESKISNAQSLIFSVYAETRHEKRAKFIFHEEVTESQLDVRVEQIFTTLREHHVVNADEDDRMSREIASIANVNSREVYLVYNSETSRWEVVDPIKEMLKRQQELRQKREPS